MRIWKLIIHVEGVAGTIGDTEEEYYYDDEDEAWLALKSHHNTHGGFTTFAIEGKHLDQKKEWSKSNA
jgi:hypothetical protein